MLAAMFIPMPLPAVHMVQLTNKKTRTPISSATASSLRFWSWEFLFTRVIIGISLGASESPSAIRPLIVALSFHQLFEGMALGGCIVQAKFKICSMATMIMFFSLATPVGIVIGIGISSILDENSSTALIVEGVLNSAAAGILFYLALVDLLAADFMKPKVQGKGKLQLTVIVSLLIGAGLMSLLAKGA